MSGKALRQLPGSPGGAVGDHQFRRASVEQGPDDAARGAARAEQQHALSGDPTGQVGAQVTQQAGTIGVVAQDIGAIEDQRIDGTGKFGTRASRVARRQACSLNGTVTLAPQPPAAAKARMLSANPSRGARIAS
jgi:hypothetical protein